MRSITSTEGGATPLFEPGAPGRADIGAQGDLFAAKLGLPLVSLEGEALARHLG